MRLRCQTAWIASLLLLPLMVSAAGPWETSLHGSLSYTHTDNLRLARPGQARAEHIGSATLGATARRQRAANEVSLAYRAIAVNYSRSDERDQLHHQFGGHGTLQVLRNRVFVDADAEYTQRLISLRDEAPVDLLTPTRNRTDVATWGGGARYQESWGRLAASEIGFRRDWIRYQARRLDAFSSDRDRFSAVVRSGPRFRTIGWTLSHSRDDYQYRDASRVRFATSEALITWHAGSRLSLFGAVGRERNDFELSPTQRPRPDDDFWRAGITWHGVRTELTAFHGERFFGSTYGLALNHRSPWATWTVDYTEQPATLGSVELVPTVELIELPTGERLLVEFEVPELVPEAYLSRRLSVGASGSRARTQWAVRAYHDDREYQLTTNRDQQVTSISVSGGWQLAARTRATGRLGLQRNRFTSEDLTHQLWMTGASVSRQMSRYISGAVSVQHHNRNSTSRTHKYRENRVTLSLEARI